MKTLVIAPHPDDELLGCGGTLLRRKAEGAEIAWLIVTAITQEGGWTAERIASREQEIAQVAERLGVARLYNLKLPTTRLDGLEIGEIIGRFSEVFKDFEPEEVFLPSRSDVHTDHKVVFDAGTSCCKWFRYPSVRRVLAYETLSETDFGLDPASSFLPNVFIDISAQLETKLELLTLYRSELGEFPFPRSLEAVTALARVRGAASGYQAAEAFQLLRERI